MTENPWLDRLADLKGFSERLNGCGLKYRGRGPFSGAGESVDCVGKLRKNPTFRLTPSLQYEKIQAFPRTPPCGRHSSFRASVRTVITKRFRIRRDGRGYSTCTLLSRLAVSSTAFASATSSRSNPWKLKSAPRSPLRKCSPLPAKTPQGRRSRARRRLRYGHGALARPRRKGPHLQVPSPQALHEERRPPSELHRAQDRSDRGLIRYFS